MSRTSTRWHLSTRELVLIFVFWTSLAALTAANRLVDPRGMGIRVMSPVGPVALPFIEGWTWAALTPLIFWLSSRFGVDRGRWIYHLPLLIISGVLVAIGVDMILDFARVELMVPRRRGSPVFAPFRGIGRFRFLNQLIVYFAVLSAGYAREYFSRDQRRQQEAAALEAQLARARLDALRMQMNPHFLFNTLHAVSALVERDPAGVRRMIARLSELLRHTLETRADQEVPLREELSFVNRYLEIMEVRFQGKLHVDQNIEPRATEGLVPTLILQPIVENALEHGVNRAKGDGRIAIEAAVRDDLLVISVRDNGPGLEEDRSDGVGLGNTRARLQQLYGEEGSVELRSLPGEGVLAEIRLPFHTAADLRVQSSDEQA